MKTTISQKTVILSLLIFQMALLSLFAQHDTLYIYKLGQVEYKRELKDIDSISFFTDASLPVVTTKIPSDINYTKATAGGDVTSNGGNNVSERGVCWSLNPIPTIKDSKAANGSGNGSFNVDIYDLTSNTTYYLRAYATNRVGTSYGQEVTFKTLWDGKCGAFVGPGLWKEFKCHNLGADVTADPFTLSWKLNGDYYQWGIKSAVAFGPTGPAANEANKNSITGWRTSFIPNNLWLDAVKTENDPCPQGFRVPKIADWEALLANNNQKIIGSSSDWISSYSNYNSGIMFGNSLFFPTSSYRTANNGLLAGRGTAGHYWSSTEEGVNYGRQFNFNYMSERLYNYFNGIDRNQGNSVRCISDDLPTVTTSVVGKIRETTATCGGNVLMDGGLSVTSRGICWNMVGNPKITDNIIDGGTGTGSFTCGMKGLSVNTIYFVRAFAINSAGESYGETIQFKTWDGNCGAYVSSGVWKEFMCHNLGADQTAGPLNPDWKLNGNYYQWGRKNVAANAPTGSAANEAKDGPYLGWNNMPARDAAFKDDKKTDNDPCPYGYRLPSKSLWEGIIANNTKSLIGSSWTDSPTNYATGLQIGTSLYLPAAGIRTSSNGTLSERGLRGVYLSSTEDVNSKAWNLEFGLTDDKNPLKTSSMNRAEGHSVRCLVEDVVLPVVSTSLVSNITETSAVCGGYIESDGFAEIIQRGVCWGTSINPTISNNKTTDGAGVGSFNSSITGLEYGRTYHVRAYAKNSLDVAYGEDQVFTATARKPVISTVACTNIRGNTAISGGVIESDGRAGITARGVCWSKTSNMPEESNSKTKDGTGTEPFTSNISQLSPNTIYYVRAYATNSVGTGYGQSVQIRTNWEGYCGANIAPGVWKEFMCQNLGADIYWEPFTPDWRLNGDYYQWGRKVVAGSGPTSGDISGSNYEGVVGWNNTPAGSGSWNSSFKTMNDPCPEGYRVPSKTEWQGVIDNNNKLRIGDWTANYTNYSSVQKFGEKLHLPTAGTRWDENGYLSNRGKGGVYWSSDENNVLQERASSLVFSESEDNPKIADTHYRFFGNSVRCISEK